MLKQLSVAWVAACAFAASTIAGAVDISGTWRTIDDKTGFAKSLIELKKQPDGSYNGTIVKILPRPGYTPKENCQNCPAPYTNKPLLGLTILNNLKQDANSEYSFSGGSVLDPLSGKIYKGKAKVSADGRHLKLRGYVGVSVIGRSQTWLREE